MECEFHVNGIHLEHVSEFKYLSCVLDESGTDEAECSRKVCLSMLVLRETACTCSYIWQ